MLREAVASVEAQTSTEWELLVVDDGSSDGTWEWLIGQRTSIRPLRNELRRGPSAARNRGAQEARGEYVAFLDSDDLWLPAKLERQIELLESDGSLALCHSNEIWIRDGKELKQQAKHEKRGGWIFEHCLPMCRISPSAAVVRRELLLELGGFDEELEVAEDYELWLRLTCRHPVGFIEEPLVVKRGGHPDQLSNRYGRIEMFRVEALRRVLDRAPLTTDQHRAALETLVEKCEVVARGCEKRGRSEEARRYRRLPVEVE
jgi:glycosyltransferase involved in cell wall biosynthesis